MANKYTLTLDWPPKRLNPNAPMHWAKKAPIIRRYRRDCCILAKQQPIPTEFEFKITFHPPDKRRRDDDNIIGAFKAGRDGLADAWGVDDSIFKFTYVIGEPVKGGAVIVEEI